MRKVIRAAPDWLGAPNVTDIYSVSACVSENFTDYVDLWRHNGFWFFDSPQTIEEVAATRGVELADSKLFYYEAYELQFVDDTSSWESFEAESAFRTNIEIPARKFLEGFDIVSFTVGTMAECSPLSCNGYAAEITTNSHCLFESMEDAIQALQTGRLKNCEPGPYRVIAVYSLVGPLNRMAMPTESKNFQAQALASVILRTIDKADPPRGVALSALSYCRNQFEDRTIVETAILVSGCSATGFLCNEDMELYYDIAKDGQEVAFISKGWDDPGFRLGELVTVPGDIAGRLDDVKNYCDTNGVVMSSQKNEEADYEVVLELVIYCTGFDGRTFAQALSTLIDCSDKLKRG